MSNQRYTVFKLVSVVGGLISLGTAIAYTVLLDGNYALLWLYIALGTILLANLAILQWHQQNAVSYGTALIVTFFAVHISSWYSGGCTSPDLYLLAVLILGTYLLFNRTLGRVAVVISVLDVLFFYFYRDRLPTNSIPLSAVEWNAASTLIIVLGLTGAVAYGLDLSKDLALSELTYSNKKLKKAAAELEKLSIAINSTDNSIMITNAEGKIEWVNNGFVKLTGYTLEDVVGTYGDMLRKEGKTGFADPGIYQRCIDERKSVNYTEINVSKTGREYWLATTFTPIFNEDGEVKNFIAIDTDVTERKQMEEELIKAMAVAEESVKNQREFINNVSHEIQSPLHGMISMTNVLANTDITEEQRTLVETLRMAANTLNLTLNDILDLSNIRAKKNNKSNS